VKRLPKRTVVIVGGGLCAGLISRQLTAKGIDVLVLERGGDHTNGAEARLPSQRDELRWDRRQGLMQNWQRETYTLRHSTAEESLPVRWMDAFIPGEGVGGAASHWNGCTWRWAEYDPILRSRYTSRYGKAAIPPEMPLQDWGTTYHELEPYHHLFEKLFGLSGQAGNIRGVIQSGGNRFEAPRRDEYPQKPLEITEAGIVFSQAAESLGYRPFPQPAANSSGAYINTDGQRLGRCQYCGHCERFVCEAHAKASPDVLLYPMLRARKGFELRTHAQVLGVEYDRGAKRVTGVRYLDLESGQEYEQPADVVILAAFTMTNTRLLLLGGIGEPYNPTEQRGVVGKNFCYQTQSSVSVFLRKHWINPFLASGSSGTVIDEFNNDNFDHSGLPFLGGGEHQHNRYQRAPHSCPADATGNTGVGHDVEESHGGLVCPRLLGRCAR
jgi:gluconate 2-dehydrogenase alpha chain